MHYCHLVLSDGSVGGYSLLLCRETTSVGCGCRSDNVHLMAMAISTELIPLNETEAEIRCFRDGDY